MSKNNNSCTKEICDLFKILQNSKNKNEIIESVSKLFCLLYREKLKRKLLYHSKEEAIYMYVPVFKNDSVILESYKNHYSAYDSWVMDCFEKYVKLLFQLLNQEDECLVKKSLSVLFSCLQCELKIYQRICKYGKGNTDSDKEEKGYDEMDTENQKENAFPIFLYKRIISNLLKVKNMSVSIIKHICQNYLCIYYDLNYFFLSIFKILSIEKRNKRNELSDSQLVELEEEKKEEGKWDNLQDNERENNENKLICAILVNSIKPKEKKREFHIKKSNFLKKGKLDLFFSEVMGMEEEKARARKRKYEEIEREKAKKDLYNYESDDTIEHLPSESEESHISESYLDYVNIQDEEDMNNIDDNDEFSYENFGEEDNIMKEETERIKIKRKKNIEHRKDKLFLNVSINERLYARVYSNAWFYFITLYKHDYEMVLRLLNLIPFFVFPYTNNPYYLIDFFNHSFYSSSNLFLSLSALPGIFHILTKLNLGNVLEEKLSVIKESTEEGNKDDDVDDKGEKDNASSSSRMEEIEEKEKSKGNNEKLKTHVNMYTGFYKRLYELMTPASFYYDDTNFLKIIYFSLKNKMIPLHYVTCFLKKLLRIGCLTASHISINILSVVYDILNFFKKQLQEAMFVSVAYFMNVDLQNDFFCYEDLNKNCEHNKIAEMLQKHVDMFYPEEDEDGSNKEAKRILNKKKSVQSGESGNEKGEKTEKRQSELFNLQEMLPNKYQIKKSTLTKKELQAVNQIFYEIILLNNHICENVAQYSNVYYLVFEETSQGSLHEFYVDPTKINWSPENSLFSFLKNFLNFKIKKEDDVTPCGISNRFTSVFI